MLNPIARRQRPLPRDVYDIRKVVHRAYARGYVMGQTNGDDNGDTIGGVTMGSKWLWAAGGLVVGLAAGYGICHYAR